MIVLKIIGIVLLCLVALILILLVCPIRADLRFASNSPFSYKIKLLFITVVKPKKETEKQKKTEKPERQKSKSAGKGKSKKTDIRKTLQIIFSAIKKMPALIKHIKVEKFAFNCVCSGDDAAQTAIKYGALCSVVYPFAAFVQEKSMFGKSPEIALSADFESGETKFDARIILNCLVIFALILLIKLGIDYAKSGGIENERK